MRRRLATPLLAMLMVAAGGPLALAQKAGGTLHVSHRDNPPSASIHEEATISTVMPFMSIYNNLVVFDPKEKQDSADHIVPDLATELAWSNGGKDLTFKLRDGVKWHDGKPFSSADVKCTWDMLKGGEDSKLRKNPHKPWYFNLKEVTTNGPRDVTFHLGRPQPSFLTFLAGAFSPVYPCHIPTAQMRTKPIGTGPFKFVEYRLNESMRLERNPDYWKQGLPYLDGIEYRIVPNRATRMLGFIAGKFDMTYPTDVSVPLLKDIRSQSPDAQCVMRPTNVSTNLIINRDVAPFNNPDIR